MIPIEEARDFVLSSCASLGPEKRSLDSACWHVLAEMVVAPVDVPPFANSAMDGYALRAADTSQNPTRLRVVDTVMAGQSPSVPVGGGEAARIMTGAPLPTGADAICMVERTTTESDGAIVIIEPTIEPGTHVRAAGSDMSIGEEVIRAGTVLTPPHIGVLASLGIDAVLVHRRPRIGVLSTGDELDATSKTLSIGKIRDANRPSLLAQLRADGFDVTDLGIAQDEETVLSRLLEEGSAQYDAIVASGGVSVGDRDVVRIVLEKLGGDTMRWMQVAVKPAKPFAFGRIGPNATPVFGLPGNPVSALVSYELFVRPALRSMAGHKVLDRPRISAVADVDLTRVRDEKVHLVRASARADAGGAVHVVPAGGQDSHMLHTMAEANALAILPDGEGVPAGARVQILLLQADELQALDDHERP